MDSQPPPVLLIAGKPATAPSRSPRGPLRDRAKSAPSTTAVLSARLRCSRCPTGRCCASPTTATGRREAAMHPVTSSSSADAEGTPTVESAAGRVPHGCHMWAQLPDGASSHFDRSDVARPSPSKGSSTASPPARATAGTTRRALDCRFPRVEYWLTLTVAMVCRESPRWAVSLLVSAAISALPKTLQKLRSRCRRGAGSRCGVRAGGCRDDSGMCEPGRVA